MLSDKGILLVFKRVQTTPRSVCVQGHQTGTNLEASIGGNSYAWLLQLTATEKAPTAAEDAAFAAALAPAADASALAFEAARPASTTNDTAFSLLPPALWQG